MPPASLKKLAELFFSPQSNSNNLWICKDFRRTVKKSGTRYTSLCLHIYTYQSHSIANRLRQKQKANAKLIQLYKYPDKTIQIKCWLDSIVNGLLPFLICEKEVFRSNMNYNSICRNISTKYLRLVEENVAVVFYSLV